MIKPKCDLFSPDLFNSISDIFANACGADPKKLGEGDAEAKEKFYKFLTNTPYTSLIVHIGDSLMDLGYDLRDKND